MNFKVLFDVLAPTSTVVKKKKNHSLNDEHGLFSGDEIPKEKKHRNMVSGVYHLNQEASRL